MAGRKITSYTGGPVVDPNAPCFTWWDYIMNRSSRTCQDPGPFRGKGGREPPGAREAIFTDEFYSGIVPKVPLQFGNLSPFLGAPVVPVLDLLGLSSGPNSVNAMDRTAAEKLFSGFVDGADYPPLVASAAAGTVATVSIRNNPGSTKRIFIIFLSQIATSQIWAWRRHDASLATLASGPTLPVKCTDGVTVVPAILSSADIAAASFPPAGSSEVRFLHTSGQFGPNSPTAQALGWLDPGKGMIVYSSTVFGDAIVASVRPAGQWTIWTE